HYILLPAKKTPPNLYKFTKAAAAARSPPIEAFLFWKGSSTAGRCLAVNLTSPFDDCHVSLTV
ncbi:MAG: hypothetical protein II074_03255, partial [Ruminococcus sp.]|nr:hypothetical protein [Ruminococcus sp.]